MHVPKVALDISLGRHGTPEFFPWFSFLRVFLSNGDSGQTKQTETGV